MEIYVSQQVWLFVFSCLVGMLLGMLYDVFRILRIAFPSPEGVVLAEDILFFLFSLRFSACWSASPGCLIFSIDLIIGGNTMITKVSLKSCSKATCSMTAPKSEATRARSDTPPGAQAKKEVMKLSEVECSIRKAKTKLVAKRTVTNMMTGRAMVFSDCTSERENLVPMTRPEAICTSTLSSWG